MTTELQALQAVHDALVGLEDADARDRVLRWACERFSSAALQPRPSPVATPELSASGTVPADNGVSGLGARARQWLNRHAVGVAQLDDVFVDHGDGFELALEQLPGMTTKEQVKSAYLLTGVMKLLQMDNSEFPDSNARDLCRRYACYNKKNHQKALRAVTTLLIADGQNWRLTPAGERAAAELIKASAGPS